MGTTVAQCRGAVRASGRNCHLDTLLIERDQHLGEVVLGSILAGAGPSAGDGGDHLAVSTGVDADPPVERLDPDHRRLADALRELVRVDACLDHGPGHRARAGDCHRNHDPGHQASQSPHTDPGHAAHRLPCRRRSAPISRAAFRPGTPVTPPPGCAPELQRYSPSSGIR
jgi:hypothetical protein